MVHGRYTVASIKKHHDGSSVVELTHAPAAEPGPDDEVDRNNPNRPAVQILKGRFDMHVPPGKEADSYKVGQFYELGLGKEGDFSRDPRYNAPADNRTAAQIADDADDSLGTDDSRDTRTQAQKTADAKGNRKP
jgi:hypothetical protein